MIVTAEDMIKMLREQGDHGFFCPLRGAYPCEVRQRGCYCHERYLLDQAASQRE